MKEPRSSGIVSKGIIACAEDWERDEAEKRKPGVHIGTVDIACTCAYSSPLRRENRIFSETRIPRTINESPAEP